MAEVGNIPRLTVEHLAPHARPMAVLKKSEPSAPIGVFDSGVGGLSVLSEVMKQLPNEDVIYLADTARVPFGGRPVQEIIKINHQILNFFSRQGAKMVIMACGTSSAIAYPKVKAEYKFPIISMIEPGARAARMATKNKIVGVIATQNTIDSGAFQDALWIEDKVKEVVAEACPLFVPLIEGGFIEAEETKKVAEEYLKPHIKAGVDTLILGCTHYPHLRKILHAIIKAELIDPAVEVAKEAKGVLSKKHLNKTDPAPGHYTYYVTSNPLQFETLGSKLLGRAIVGVKHVEL